MAALFSYGILLAISIFIGLIFTIIGIFVGHIILFDSIFFAVISGIVCHQLWNIHPALCVLIAVAAFTLLFWLQRTRVGFWIIGTLLSAFWAFIFGIVAYLISNQDMIWFYVVAGLGFLAMLGLHRSARGNDNG